MKNKTIETSAALVAAIVAERLLEIKTHEAWQSVRILTRLKNCAAAKRRWWVDRLENETKGKK